MVRRVLSAAAVTALCGCGYFLDLGGLSEDTPPSSDAGAPDAPASAADAATPPTGADAATTGAYRAAVLADGPVSYWPMDDAPDSLIAKDVVGGRHAPLTGKATFGVAGVAGTALSTSDRTAFLEVGDVFDFAGQAPFTVEVWALPKLTQTFTNLGVKRDGSDENYGWVLYFRDSGNVQFEQHWPGGSRVGFSEGTRSYTKPAHVVVTFDGAKLAMYLDGEKLVKTFEAAGNAVDIAQPLRFAVSYEGLLDEIAIYDRALPADRVTAHRAAAGF